MQNDFQGFDTVEERQAFLMEDFRNAVTFAIDYNPRGVYDLINALWPADKLPKLLPGAERGELQKKRMYEVAVARLGAFAEPMDATLQFLALVPRNEAAANTWLKNS